MVEALGRSARGVQPPIDGQVPEEGVVAELSEDVQRAMFARL